MQLPQENRASKRVKIQFPPLTVHDVLEVDTRQLCVDSEMPNVTSATKNSTLQKHVEVRDSD